MKFILAIIIGTSVFSTAGADTLDTFIQIAKKTSSNYAGNAQVDVNNNESISFETLIDNQKIFLTIGSTKINSSVYTLINSDGNYFKRNKSNKALPLPPVIVPGNLSVVADSNALCSSTGTAASGSDTSCVGKDCTLKQLIISKCNETNCWKENSSTDHTFSQGIFGEFNLTSKIDISKCVDSNSEGVKHLLTISEGDSLKGGNVHYQVTVMNDVTE